MSDLVVFNTLVY